MAYYFLYPEIDTTLYSHPDRTTANTGHDEILELCLKDFIATANAHNSRGKINWTSCNFVNKCPLKFLCV